MEYYVSIETHPLGEQRYGTNGTLVAAGVATPWNRMTASLRLALYHHKCTLRTAQLRILGLISVVPCGNRNRSDLLINRYSVIVSFMGLNTDLMKGSLHNKRMPAI